MIPTWGVQGFWESYQGVEFIKFAQLGLYRVFYLEDHPSYVVNNHGFVLAGFYTRSSNFMLAWRYVWAIIIMTQRWLPWWSSSHRQDVFGMTTFGFNFHIYIPTPKVNQSWGKNIYLKYVPRGYSRLVYVFTPSIGASITPNPRLGYAHLGYLHPRYA